MERKYFYYQKFRRKTTQAGFQPGDTQETSISAEKLAYVFSAIMWTDHEMPVAPNACVNMLIEAKWKQRGQVCCNIDVGEDRQNALSLFYDFIGFDLLLPWPLTIGV